MKIIKFIVIFIIAISMTSCGFKDINIGIPSKIEFQELSLDGIKLKIFLPIENKNNFSFNIKSINLDLYLNGKNIGKIDKIDKLKIEANSKNIYTVYFEINTKEALSNIIYIYKELKSSSPKLEVNGYLKVSKLGIAKKVKVVHKQNI